MACMSGKNIDISKNALVEFVKNDEKSGFF